MHISLLGQVRIETINKKKLVALFFSVGAGLGVPKRGVIFSSNWLFIGYVSLL
jgi:hypothetical protein